MVAITERRVARVPRGVKGRGLDHSVASRHPARMAIYKILRASEWQALVHRGETTGSPDDVSDGFVHFSTASQLLETARKHFADDDGLLVLKVDEERLGNALRWEPSRGGKLFPHLYRPLRLADVIWSRPMTRDGGRHVLPSGVA